jgi:uncharacterized RDD family membrane protein YckC
LQKPTQVVGRRAVAFIIDVIIISVIDAVSWYVLTKDVGAGSCIGGGITINGHCRGFTDGGNRSIWLLIEFLAGVGIFWIMQGLTGKTPGKAAMGIQVVNAEGKPPGVGRAIVRSILYIVDGFPIYILPLVGFIVAMVSERNQRVGDMVANTFVVDKNFAGALTGQGAPGPFGGGPPPGYGPPPPGAGYGPPPGGAPAPPSAPPPGGGEQKADWYPDPQGQARLRYWDGHNWTDHTSA